MTLIASEVLEAQLASMLLPVGLFIALAIWITRISRREHEPAHAVTATTASAGASTSGPPTGTPAGTAPAGGLTEAHTGGGSLGGSPGSGPAGGAGVTHPAYGPPADVDPPAEVSDPDS